MKVELIIVDEVPESCCFCQFMHEEYCSVLDKYFQLFTWDAMKEKYCPLKTKDSEDDK